MPETTAILKRDVRIRAATADDIDWMLPELKKFGRLWGTALSIYPGDDIAREKLGALIEGHFFIVACREEERLGFMCGLVMPHIFNPAVKVLAELLWWVVEGHRGSRAGFLLLEEFIRWGKRNADWVTLSLQEFTGVNEGSLEARGFRVHERFFLMETLRWEGRDG